jgi:hypothetical protein
MPEEGQRAGKETSEGRAEDGYVNNNIIITGSCSYFVSLNRRGRVKVRWRPVMENSFKAPLNAIQRLINRKDNVCLILQFPFLHEKVVHGLCHEKVRVCGPAKICLKPDDDLSLTFRVGIGERNDIFASLTNIWSDPRLRARILYPRLCQSIMTLLPRNLPTSHTKARVGMLGGFFAILLYCLGAEMVRGLTCTSRNSGGRGMRQRRA